MRRPCLFKERDVKRAARAVLAMGLNIGRVEIDKDGTIVVVLGKPEQATGGGGEERSDGDSKLDLRELI